MVYSSSLFKINNICKVIVVFNLGNMISVSEDCYLVNTMIFEVITLSDQINRILHFLILKNSKNTNYLKGSDFRNFTPKSEILPLLMKFTPFHQA